MANKQLPEFLTAENDLDGNEPVYIAQGGKTRKALLQKIKEFIIGTTALTTTDTTVTGAIKEVKGIADNNTTQLNANTQNINANTAKINTNTQDINKINNKLTTTPKNISIVVTAVAGDSDFTVDVPNCTVESFVIVQNADFPINGFQIKGTTVPENGKVRLYIANGSASTCRLNISYIPK